MLQQLGFRKCTRVTGLGATLQIVLLWSRNYIWWKAVEVAALERSSVSFFEVEKHETAVSKWARARKRAAKLGKGLCKDEKAQKLALQHWLEAIDPLKFQQNINNMSTSI